MEMPKPSANMVEVFESVAPGGPEAEQRKMFGQPAAFVHGNMFMGLYGDVFQVRLGEPQRQALLQAGGTPFTVMGRVMKDYVELPETILGDRGQLEDWVHKAYAFAAALPGKQPKPARKAG